MYKFYEKIINYIFTIQLIKLKFFGAKIGKNIKVYGFFTVVGHPKRLTIDDNVTINKGVLLNCRESIHIKKGCRLSAYAKLYTATLTIDTIPRKHISSSIILEENVWVASNAIITMGVIVGKNSVIGANSVVLHNIEKNSLYAGIPAKKIRKLNIK